MLISFCSKRKLESGKRGFVCAKFPPKNKPFLKIKRVSQRTYDTLENSQDFDENYMEDRGAWIECKLRIF